jgi:hypothetical protein
MIEKYERLPEWLRWILFLPLSIALSFLIVFLFSFHDFFTLIRPTVSVVSVAIAIHTLAPRWKNGFVITSILVRMILSIGIVSFIIYMGETPNKQTYIEIGYEILSWVIGWRLYFKVFRDTKPLQKNLGATI